MSSKAFYLQLNKRRYAGNACGWQIFLPDMPLIPLKTLQIVAGCETFR
jgi:hypothetical protein